MKDKQHLIPLIITIITLFILLWMTFIKPYLDISNLEVGQVYEHSIDRENPFIKKHNKYYRILSIKKGYVQYYDSTWNDTSSMRAELFIWDSELVK